LIECYRRLERLRELNPRLCLKFNNVALGEAEGFLPLAYNPDGDSRNATLVPGKHYAETRQVPVYRLDEYIASNISSPERIKVIKIDVEGFEFQVIKGLERFLAGTKFRPLIVCEIKPWELTHLGASLDDFEQFMKKFGYRAYIIPEESVAVRMSALTDMEVLLFRA
jgi:FkbM family methyltransferase